MRWEVRDIIYFLAIPLILGAALSGQVLTRVSYRDVIAPGLAVAVVAALFLTQLTPPSNLWVLAAGFFPVGGIALPLIPLGFVLGFSLVAPVVAVQNEAPRAEVGAAIGLTRFLQSLGGSLGISLLTAFEIGRFKALSGGATSPNVIANALVSAYDEIFMILAICIAISFGFALIYVGRVRQKGAEDSNHPDAKDDAPSVLKKEISVSSTEID
jgi:hypothetical protein